MQIIQQIIQKIIEFLMGFDGVCFGTHKKPHGDELCGFALGRRFDPEYRDAKVFTFGSKSAALEVEAKAKGKITLVGIGRGEFDEHGGDEPECAATLIAKRLKLDELKFFRLFEEVRTSDLEAKSGRTQVPELVKVLYSHYDEQEIIEWGIAAYDVIIDACEAGNYHPEITGIIDDVAVEVLNLFHGEYHVDNGALKRAWKDCQAAANNKRGSLTELQTVAEFMALYKGRDAAKEWARIGLYGVFLRQIYFDAALHDVEHARRFTAPIIVDDRQIGLRGVVISGSNEQHVRAFRSNRAGNFDLAIIRNPENGNVGVFPNSKSEIPMVHCAKALRFAEAKKRGIAAAYHDLDCDGDHDQVPQWHFFAKAGMVMNGNRSYPDVENTALTIDEVVEIVSSAFIQGPALKRLNKIRIDPRFEKRMPNPVLKPDAQAKKNKKAPQSKVDRRQNLVRLGEHFPQELKSA